MAGFAFRFDFFKLGLLLRRQNAFKSLHVGFSDFVHLDSDFFHLIHQIPDFDLVGFAAILHGQILFLGEVQTVGELCLHHFVCRPVGTHRRHFAVGGFGGGRSQRRNAPQRGESIRQTVVLSFEEAAFGCEKAVTVERYETCDTCHGNGCAPGTSPEVCPDCHGTGTVQGRRQTPMGVFATSSPCPKCGGKGRIIHQPCKDCRGSGMVRKKKTIQASIPAGIDNGQTISIRGQGNAGKNGGPAGDLLITITVRPHELFRREGTSVLCEAPITFTQAVLGAELEIPTIDGKVKYTLPEGTQSGTTFRLKGKGIPSINGRGRGDQYVTVYIETPKNLNKEQKEALKKFAETMGESNYEEQKKFFKKFKK